MPVKRAESEFEVKPSWVEEELLSRGLPTDSEDITGIEIIWGRS
jgi:hypothetical protein